MVAWSGLSAFSMHAILRASVRVGECGRLSTPGEFESRHQSQAKGVFATARPDAGSSFWPEDIRTALLQSDTMTFFFCTSVPA